MDSDRLCYIGYMDGKGTPHTMTITESCLPWALQQGWSLAFRFSAQIEADVEPSQSNPRREDDADQRRQ